MVGTVILVCLIPFLWLVGERGEEIWKGYKGGGLMSIGWHTSEGFALQLVEMESEIAALIDYDTLNSTCAAWDSYATASGVEEEDSGV